MEDNRLLQMLVNAKKITPAQAKQAKEMQSVLKGQMTAVVCKLGFMKDQELTQFIAQQEGLKIADVEGMVIPENLVKLISRELIEKYEVFPVAKRGNTITVAMSDPKDFDAIQEIAFMTNCRIEAQLAPHKSISKIITQYFAENDEKRKELDNLGLLDDHPEVVKALIPLLISKGIITEQELKEKANELKLLS
jgi:type IV pilus assembly protein PilB